MHNIIGKNKIYFQPSHMFRQIDCHLQGTCNSDIYPRKMAIYLPKHMYGLKIYLILTNNLVHLLVLEYTRISFIIIKGMGRDSIVGIATRYGLVSPGIESRWGRDFMHPSRTAVQATQPPPQWVSRLFLVGKAAGAWR
jgi:hypothetical protein